MNKDHANSHIMDTHNVKRCLKFDSSTQVIVIPKRDMARDHDWSHYGNIWKQWAQMSHISSIMYDDGSQNIIFRAKNSLGFRCKKTYEVCEGDQKAKELDFTANSKLKELARCMECAMPKKCTKQESYSFRPVWDNGGLSDCESESEEGCKCKDDFKSCVIQPDDRDSTTRCTVCIRRTGYQETLQKAKCLDEGQQDTQFIWANRNEKIVNNGDNNSCIDSHNNNSTGTPDNTQDDGHLPLILGCSIGALALIIATVLAVVLVKRRRMAKVNHRNSKDENPIYGPRETVYVDEVKYAFENETVNCIL